MKLFNLILQSAFFGKLQKSPFRFPYFLISPGCRLTGIPFENVVAALEKAGFTVES